MLLVWILLLAHVVIIVYPFNPGVYAEWDFQQG